MALEHFSVIVIKFLFCQVLTSYAQYVQYAGAPYPIPYVTGYPVTNYAPSPTPVFTQSYSQPAPNYQTASSQYKTPAKPVPNSAKYTQTGPITPAHVAIPANPISPPIYQPPAYQTPPSQQPIKATSITTSVPEPTIVQPIKAVTSTKEILPNSNPSLSKDPISGSSPPFDSNILNNLAIALQLLIVSNLIHNPPQEPIPAPQVLDEDIFPAIAPLPIAFIPPNLPEPPSYPNPHIPNSNFLGTSSFVDTGISKSMMSAYGSPTIPASRSAGLMSPYDAIGPNSPYFEVFHSKPEPKSPYHSTSDYKDLFALTELFKI